MAELLKNIYNEQFFKRFTDSIVEVIPEFNVKLFLNSIYDKEWNSRELKQRMRHITMVLKEHLSDDFRQNTISLLKLISVLKKNGFKDDSLEFIFFPDFIEIYGIDNYKTAMEALEQITQFVTCEFAVRPFIIAYPEKMIQQMALWSKHQHPMVRRLATEGYRPRLPWAMALPALKKDPTPILPILERLRKDGSESVRRSVANNLNDISKDNPQIVIDLVKKWQGESVETDRLIKHASRTLLKQGNKELMKLFGFGSIDQIEISNFKIITPKIKIGEYVEFAFGLKNNSNSMSKIRLEYGLYYQKANGSMSKKVFKISEKEYANNLTTQIHRRQSFKIITTRRFHLGQHQIALIINGVELDKLNFELIE